MENNRIWVIPDVHCRNFYKPILNIKDEQVVFLGDYMDSYYWEGNSDKQGIDNLQEILEYAKNNKNVTLLFGNHDCSWMWSALGWERTSQKYYQELHKIYRDNVNLFSIAKRIGDTLFTHAGVCNGWINTMNNIFNHQNKNFQITQDNIVDYLTNEFLLELESDDVPNQHFMYSSLDSEIFCVGRSRGGRAPYGGPVWCDFYDDFNSPENWNLYQIFSHTQGEMTGLVRVNYNGACVDSRAIFEYYPEKHLIIPSQINDEKTKSEIYNSSWKGRQLGLVEEHEESV